jgi:hypothetical protein
VCQDVDRQLVRLAVEVFEQSIFEEGVVGGSSQKQGHAGAEFQIVWVGEDPGSATSLYIQNKLRTLSESLTGCWR